jgi:hypothetical protein
MNSSVCLLQVDCGLPIVPFGVESKGWFRDRRPDHRRKAGDAWRFSLGGEGEVTQSRHCEARRNLVNKWMSLPEHSPDSMKRPLSAKPSFHFIPAAPSPEEPERFPPPEISHARFYLVLSCTALVVSLSSWRYLDKLDGRLGRRIPPVLAAMKVPSTPPGEPNASSLVSEPPYAGGKRAVPIHQRGIETLSSHAKIISAPSGELTAEAESKQAPR